MYKGVIKRLFRDNAHCLALTNIQTRRGDFSNIFYRHHNDCWFRTVVVIFGVAKKVDLSLEKLVFMLI